MEVIVDLRTQNERLKTAGDSGAGGSSTMPISDEIAALKRENLSLKDEVTELLRKRADSAQQFIDTTAKLEKREIEMKKLQKQ